MLVAHLDTVHKLLPKNIWFSEDNTRIKADEGIGGDDRCGVYAILHILNRLEKDKIPSVLFTTDEEIGGIGVGVFCKKFKNKKLGVNAFIEIDRANAIDVVCYSDDNYELVEKFEEMGYKYNYGSYTDIVDLMETFDISGVNLSSGYYNAHTLNEYVDLKDLMWTIENVITFIKNPNNYAKPYKYVEFRYTKSRYGGGWDTLSNGTWNYNNSYSYQKYGRDFYDDYEYCLICGKKHNMADMLYTEDGYICEECFAQYSDCYIECEDCGSLILKDSLNRNVWCGVCGSPLKNSRYQYNIDDFYKDEEDDVKFDDTEDKENS